MLLNVASATALSYGHPFLLSERCILNVLIQLLTKQLFIKLLSSI